MRESEIWNERASRSVSQNEWDDAIEQDSETQLTYLNKDLFLTYIHEFPCFVSAYSQPASVEQIYDDYKQDQLSDELDVVIEFLIDLLGFSSDYPPTLSSFILGDGFHLLDHANRAAVIKTLGYYDEYLLQAHAF